MKDKKSIYKCPVCKDEIVGRAGISFLCRKCDVEMKEVNKGIITK